MRRCGPRRLRHAGRVAGRSLDVGAGLPRRRRRHDDLRRTLGLSAAPEVVVLSASGNLDPAHPAIAAGALVLTTEAGAARLGDRAKTVSLGTGAEIDPAAAVSALRARGHRRLLLEGGPHVIGSFLEAGAVDELLPDGQPAARGKAGDAARGSSKAPTSSPD